MDASRQGIENSDLEKLNDKDKQELRQFLANESQRSQIQSRAYLTAYGRLSLQIQVY
ncbi:hypothetical protein VDGD_06305 [Verticillium dahliae]|nr:hypothetical protein VDGD_06305 [Verticillium dahliae]